MNLKIDATVLKDLQVRADNFKKAMVGLKKTATETKKAMRNFVKACSDIDL